MLVYHGVIDVIVDQPNHLRPRQLGSLRVVQQHHPEAGCLCQLSSPGECPAKAGTLGVTS